MATTRGTIANRTILPRAATRACILTNFGIRHAQAYLIRTVSIHHINLGFAVTVALEGDPTAVGRPGGLRVRSRVYGETHTHSSDVIGDVDIRIAVYGPRERNRFPSGAIDVELNGDSNVPRVANSNDLAARTGDVAVERQRMICDATQKNCCRFCQGAR